MTPPFTLDAAVITILIFSVTVLCAEVLDNYFQIKSREFTIRNGIGFRLTNSNNIKIRRCKL